MSLGQIKEIPCGHSRGYISCSIDLESGQNVCLDETSDKFEYGSSWLINYVTRPNYKNTLWVL